MKYIIVVDIYDVDKIIEDRFKRYDTYYKLFDNVYIIETEKNSEEIYNEISFDYSYIRIVIFEINSKINNNKNYFGRFDKSLWEYINQ